ncbi:MAG: hypothetical protein K2H66_05655 [Oscillospiraceae bacterium]|nr:hypothetical protein [Oscillospiraceae bacterium]
MSKKYLLYDFYENYGVVDEFDTLKEAQKAYIEWVKDTDGECYLNIFQLDETTKDIQICKTFDDFVAN